MIALIALVANPAFAQPHDDSAAVTETPRQVAIGIVQAGYDLESGRDSAVISYAKSFEDSFRTSIASKPNGALILTQNATAIAAGLAAVKDEVRKQYPLVVVPRVTQAVADVYDHNFALNELVAIRAYYSTPQAQAFLASFAKGESEVAGRDPIVTSYRESVLGRKEAALSQQIASTLVKANLEAIQSLNAVVGNRFKTAMAQSVASRSRQR